MFTLIDYCLFFTILRSIKKYILVNSEMQLTGTLFLRLYRYNKHRNFSVMQYFFGNAADHNIL